MVVASGAIRFFFFGNPRRVEILYYDGCLYFGSSDGQPHVGPAAFSVVGMSGDLGFKVGHDDTITLSVCLSVVCRLFFSSLFL